MAYFTKNKDIRFSNGYLDWAAVLLGQNNARFEFQGYQRNNTDGPVWQSIFVKASNTDMTATAFFAKVDDKPDLSYDPIEKDLNDPEKNGFSERGIEAVLYRHIDLGSDTISNDHDFFEVLFEGAFVTVYESKNRSDQCQEAPKTALNLVGIIDDGIGCLNARFRKKDEDGKVEKTRFQDFWMQTLASIIPETDDGTGKNKMLAYQGRRIGSKQIDQYLKRLPKSSEIDIYREVSNNILPQGTRSSFESTLGHGSHMLDLAAGAWPNKNEQISDIPIIATQLPPQTFDDTSGVRLTINLLQGLRWQILRARQANAETLSINISLGILAGVKDGTDFLSQQIAREIEWAKHGGGPDVKVMLPFGNSYRTRQVAELVAKKGTRSEVGLRVLPDDLTPSFVEIRLPTELNSEQDVEKLKLKLSDPAGSEVFKSEMPEEGSVSFAGRTKDSDGNLVPEVAFYHVKEGERGYLMLAFAPTRSFNGLDTVCRSGLWNISLKSSKQSGDQNVVLQVQRDDEVSRFRTGARQAYFDDATAWEYEPSRREYSLPGDHSAISRAGTNSAYAVPGLPDDVKLVGGALVREKDWDNVLEKVRAHDVRPALYASKGDEWTANAPSQSAITETGYALEGLRASSVLSSATVRLSGSSTASAMLTRVYLDALVGASTKTLPATKDTERLGQSTVVEARAARHRE